VDGILNPEHGHIQDQVADGAAPDAGNDREPHEPHHVHPLARSDERSRHGENDGRKDVEQMDEAGQVRRIDQCRLHTFRAERDPRQYATVALLHVSRVREPDIDGAHE
jgi:hypothetical protein